MSNKILFKQLIPVDWDYIHKNKRLTISNSVMSLIKTVVALDGKDSIGKYFTKTSFRRKLSEGVFQTVPSIKMTTENVHNYEQLLERIERLGEEY